MAGNSFGKLLRLTSFGESHGPAIGGVIDGFPAGVDLDLTAVQAQMARRRPGQSRLTTQRKEGDEVEWLSGIFDGKSTGMPIAFLIRNKDAKSKDYDHLKHNFRPSHADQVYQEKYGLRDYRGGGRSSARETAVRVAAGSLAQQLIPSLKIRAYVSGVGSLELDANKELDLEGIDANIVRCPDPSMAAQFEAEIESARKSGDSLGGIISCRVSNMPIGLGEPVFDKLHADLGKAMLSINAVKGFEIGSGFKGSQLKGSEHNDSFDKNGKRLSNNAGGVEGGISNGEDLYFRIAFKPVATIMKDQIGINDQGESVSIKGKGRHDPCVVPRAVPIVEAMTALVLADHLLLARTTKF